MSANKNWIKGLDSIRFFLALIVLLSHIRNPYILLLKNSSFGVLRLASGLVSHMFFGVGAVIAFFVISGFVIHFPNRKKERIDAPRFLARRWIRIGGPLLVVGLIANHFGYFYNIPIWSLYCEIIYYTLYPLLFAWKTSWRNKFLLSFVLSYIVIFALSGSSISALLHQTANGYNINYWQHGDYLTWVIGLPCWLVGTLLAERIDKIDYTVSTLRIFIWRAICYAGATIIFMLATHFYLSTILSLNIFAILVGVWLEKEIAYYRTHRASAVFEYFGKFSYSLYMCHQLCFILIGTFMVYDQYTYFLYILLSLVISWLVYLAVEYPSHRLAQKVGYRK